MDNEEYALMHRIAVAILACKLYKMNELRDRTETGSVSGTTVTSLQQAELSFKNAIVDYLIYQKENKK